MNVNKTFIVSNLYQARLILNHNERINFLGLVDTLRQLDNDEFDSTFFGQLSTVFDDRCQSYETMQELHTFLEQKYHYQQTLTEFWVNLKDWYINYEQAKNWYSYYLLSLYDNPVVQADIQHETAISSDLGEFLDSVVALIEQDYI